MSDKPLVRFVVAIEFGSAAMTTRDDLVHALRDVIKHVTECVCFDGTVRDANGTKVGHWKLIEDTGPRRRRPWES